MHQGQHSTAFAVVVAWTLALLFLGSVVHATGSSLACPDWPTCFGTMAPAMEGGVFWEHLHRLVAGGLILLFGLATVLAWRQDDRRWVGRLAVAGLVLLLVQAVFGGLTVLLRLPDAISTTHLGLALVFLAIAVVLAGATSPRRARREPTGSAAARVLRLWAPAAGALVLAQSLLGGVVRHAEAGMACGRGVLCGGVLVPERWGPEVTLQWSHRLVGVLTAVAVLAVVVRLVRVVRVRHVRRTALLAGAVALAQVGLGFLSAWSVLDVVPVSLHTLGAAGLLSLMVLLGAWGWLDRSAAESDLGVGIGTNDRVGRIEPARADAP